MGNKNDSFGNRMKIYEQAEAGRKTCPLLPVLIRLDGKGFSKWTKGLKRPYDEKLTNIMVNVTKILVEELNAKIGYTQSDEITLLLYSDSISSEIYFSGKIQKLVSVSSSIATANFNKYASVEFPNKPLAFFDSRVWSVPTKTEAINSILWREKDATKNSISMAARYYYSHKKLMNKNSSELQEMLFEKDVNWNNYPSFFKRGTYVQRKVKKMKFNVEEIDKLPKNHNARKDPNMTINRSVVEIIDMPPLLKVINKEGVIFKGEYPIMSETLDDVSLYV